MGSIRILIMTLIAMLAVACSSAEEAPKAKGTSSGESLNAESGSGSITPTPAATTEKNASTETSSNQEEDEAIDEDDGDDGDDENEGSGKGSVLTFKSSQRDDNDYSIAVKVGSKDWQRKEWPNEGESIEFAGLCKGTKMTIDVKIIHEDGKEVTKGSQLKVEASGKTAKVAFEMGKEEGQSSEESSPDDLVGELSCSKTKLSVK